jgi:hypothetical protein
MLQSMHVVSMEHTHDSGKNSPQVSGSSEPTAGSLKPRRRHRGSITHYASFLLECGHKQTRALSRHYGLQRKNVFCDACGKMQKVVKCLGSCDRNGNLIDDGKEHDATNDIPAFVESRRDY